MNKIKVLAFIAIAAILSACGTDDGSPPELKKNYRGDLSPFDTLTVEFDSKLIDLDTSSESNVVLNNGKKWVERKTSSKELYFIGANTTLGGSHYFAGGKSDSIVFKNIKNSDYKKEITVFYFSTLTILDNEPNNEPKDANDIEQKDANGIELLGKITDGVTFAGIIDKKMGMSGGFPIKDEEDFYKLNLKRGDRISITVTNTIKNKPTPIKVRFFGDCYSDKSLCNDKVDSTTSKNGYSVTLEDIVKVGHEQEGDIVGKISPFYIDIFENANDTSNPYTVTVKKL